MPSLQELYSLLFSKMASVSTDTRSITPGDIYFALKGPSFDGNLYAKEALEKGAQFAVIDNPHYNSDERYIVVDDVLATLQDLAKLHQQTFLIPLIAIGGSNGKTTTKELINAVLSKKYQTHVTQGNLNNDIGVPLTLLSMPAETEIGIIEIGANHPGEHLVLLEMILPTHVLVTNNGADHLEGFCSLEGVRKANKEIYDWAREYAAHAFVNTTISDLVEDSTAIECTAYPAKSHESISSLYAGVRYDGIDFTSSLFGSYNEPNMLAAIAIGEFFDVSLAQIREAIANYTPSLKRSQYIQADGYDVILDCYNANPSSMELALRDFFGHTVMGKRITIIGDMLEMGHEEQKVHVQVLELVKNLKKENDIVICVGPRFFASKEVFPFQFYENSEAAREYFNTLDLTGKTIFVKASRGIALENVIKEKIPLA